MNDDQIELWAYAMGVFSQEIISGSIWFEHLEEFLSLQSSTEKSKAWELSSKKVTMLTLDAIERAWKIRRSIPSMRVGYFKKWQIKMLLYATARDGQLPTDTLAKFLGTTERKLRNRFKKGLPGLPEKERLVLGIYMP